MIYNQILPDVDRVAPDVVNLEETDVSDDAVVNVVGSQADLPPDAGIARALTEALLLARIND